MICNLDKRREVNFQIESLSEDAEEKANSDPHLDGEILSFEKTERKTPLDVPKALLIGSIIVSPNYDSVLNWIKVDVLVWVIVWKAWKRI